MEAGMFRLPRTEAYSSRLGKEFFQLRINDELTDFKVISKHRTFHCHKVILAGCSPVLKAMMLSNMTEASKQTVDLNNTPPDVLSLILDYMYTGDASVPNDLLLPTLEACDYLELLELKERCLRVASSAIKPSNVISWYKVADSMNLDELKSKCSEILSSSLIEISKSAEFLALKFAEVSSYITDVQHTDADPDDILDAAMNWITNKANQHQEFMHDLLQKVHLHVCSIMCLEKQLQDHEALFISCPAAYRTITKILIEMAKQGDGRMRNKVKKTKLVVLGGQKLRKANNVCWELEPLSKQFTEMCKIAVHPFHQLSVDIAVCRTPQGFAVTGAENNDKCVMYILATKSWKALQSLLVPRHAHGCIFINREIFVLGGNVPEDKPSRIRFGGAAQRPTPSTSAKPTTKSPSVHSLKVASGKWQVEAELPFAVNYPEVASINNSIFLLDTSTNQLLELHLDGAESWVMRSAVPGESCFGARMVTVGDQIMVAGGNAQVCVGYKPSSDTWWTANTPFLQHYFGALVCHERKVYLIGGAAEDQIEEYNLDTETWSACDLRMPEKLWKLHALVLDA